MEKTVEGWSDEKLFKVCRCYGHRILKGRYRFMGLLPEVNRRRLYEKKGFSSIFVFAFQLAGLSEQQVRRALNLDENFEKKGLVHLRAVLVKGDVSINKLARVASIATPENEVELVGKLKVLPQAALEVLVKDVNGFSQPKVEPKSVRAHNTLQLSPEISQRLLDLQQKGIDINELLLEFLNQREKKLALAKEDRAEEIFEEAVEEKRYMAIKTRDLIRQEYGEKCAMPTCILPAVEIHHKIPFSMLKNHIPHLLAPLCKEHHQMAHAIHIEVWEKRQDHQINIASPKL